MSGTYSTRDRLAEDWVTIWQSELAALAADQESAEHMQAAFAAWFASTSMLQPHDGVTNSAARTDASARPPAAAAAPDAGDTIARLEQRVAELERRLAGSLAAP